MKITEISAPVSRTFNLGNFNSLRVEATATACVDDVGEIEEARAACLAEVRETLRRAYEEFKPKEKPNA